MAEKNQQDNPSHKKPIKTNETLKDLAILFFGLLGGSVFDSLTNNVFNLQTKVVIVITTLGLAIVILIAIQTHRHTNFVKAKVQETAESLASVADRIGATIRMNKFGEEVTTNAFNEYIALINQAESLHVIDAYPWTGQISTDQDSELVHWYEALNKFIDDGKSYTRILQNSNRPGRTNILHTDDIKNPIIEKHFQKIIQASKSNPKCSLRSSDIMLPNVVFMLIDRRYLIWEVPWMDKLPGGKKGFHLSMDFFVEDTSQRFTQEVLNVWNMVYEQSVRVSEIKPREIPARAAIKGTVDE